MMIFPGLSQPLARLEFPSEVEAATGQILLSPPLQGYEDDDWHTVPTA
jgi:hypothetical protein